MLRARQRRRSTLAATLAMAVVLAAGGVVWRNLAVEQPPVGPRPRPVPVLPRHAQARIPVVGGPVSLAVAEGSVWVANQEAGTVSRIDPASNRVVETIKAAVFVGGTLAGSSHQVITAGAGAVWVAHGNSTARIDPATNRVTATWPFGPGSGGLLVSQGALWVSQDDGTVLRVDAATGKQVARVRVASGVGRMPLGLATLDGAVWAASTGVTVVRIDPGTNRAGPPIELDSLSPTRELAIAAGSLWLAMDDGSVLRIDPASRRVTARVPIPAYGAIAVGAGAAWAADAQANVVYRIDPHASD
jgi:YVTN family beta-propeller protein